MRVRGRCCMVLLLAAAGCGGRVGHRVDPVAPPDADRNRPAETTEAADHGLELPDLATDADGAAPCPFVVTADKQALRRFATVTFRARPDWQVSNPFDPDEVRLEAELVAAEGSTTRVPAFYYQAYSRSLVDGVEVLTQAGEPEWQVRFTPAAEGFWSWRWVATVKGKTCATSWDTMLVLPPDPEEHGFVRVSAEDPRYLAFDDGTPYFPVGENMAWPDARGTYAYDEWMGKLTAQGGNYIRVWMASWSHALEWVVYGPDGQVLATTLGDYTQHLDRAWQLDRVFAAAAERGIRIMLCLLHHGQFSTEVNAVWQDNPYSATFGGPLKDPTEFFTNPEARALFERRLRYIVARWSHASNLLAWELWNEVDYTQQYDGGIQAEWHKHMAQVLHQLDPNDHLVTTSTSMMGKLFGLDAALFGLPELDFSQFHLYGSGDDLTLDLGMTIPGLVGELAALGKPVLAGEVGVDYRGPAETLAMDPGFVGFRDILWLPVVAGSAGIGMHWWWDNLIDPLDLYPLFGPVAQAVSGVDFAAQQFESVTWEQEHTDRQVHAFLLRGDTMGILWLKDAQDQYWRREDAPPVSGLQLEPPDVPEGAWTVTWLDPAAGVPAKSAAWDGASPLAVPTFKSSLAARMEVH